MIFIYIINIITSVARDKPPTIDNIVLKIIKINVRKT